MAWTSQPARQFVSLQPPSAGLWASQPRKPPQPPSSAVSRRCMLRAQYSLSVDERVHDVFLDAQGRCRHGQGGADGGGGGGGERLFYGPSQSAPSISPGDDGISSDVRRHCAHTNTLHAGLDRRCRVPETYPCRIKHGKLHIVEVMCAVYHNTNVALQWATGRVFTLLLLLLLLQQHHACSLAWACCTVQVQNLKY